MLCSVDSNDSVVVLTLLYLLLAHVRHAHCSHSEHVPALNPEVLPYQYLFTMLLSIFCLILTTLPLFPLFQQAFSSTSTSISTWMLCFKCPSPGTLTKNLALAALLPCVSSSLGFALPVPLSPRIVYIQPTPLPS